MELSLLSLFVLGVVALTETRAGSHSMRYFHTAMSRPELGDSQFITVGYVDDQQFVRFDSSSESQRMEPRAAWMDKMDEEEPNYWEEQTQIYRKNAQIYRGNLETLRGYYNQSHGGLHTIQRMIGCEVSPEGSFRKGFYQFAYDGHDYIALHSETLSWTAADTGAENTKRKWEPEKSIAESYKAYLEKECTHWLKKYLEMGKDVLLRTDPPSVRVTRYSGPDGEVSLRCRAHGFYPAEISLTWLRDGEEQLQDTEFIETRPGGDGTFQKWAAVAMAPGQEDRYSCRVQHEALAQPLSLRWEPEASSVWVIVGVTAGVLVLVTAVVAGAVILRRRNSGGKGGVYVPAQTRTVPRAQTCLSQPQLMRISLCRAEEKSWLYRRPHFLSCSCGPLTSPPHHWPLGSLLYWTDPNPGRIIHVLILLSKIPSPPPPCLLSAYLPLQGNNHTAGKWLRPDLNLGPPISRTGSQSTELPSCPPDQPFYFLDSTKLS